MELEFWGSSLGQLKRKRKWVALLGALGLTFYGAIRFYNSPAIVKKRQKLLKLFDALISVAETVSDTAEVVGILSKDVEQFLRSDSDQIPQSLKQVAKLATSDGFLESLARITRATTLGFFQGYRHVSTPSPDRTFSDKIVDKLFSEAGSGFASVVLGSFARDLVMALYSERETKDRKSSPDGGLPTWVEVSGEEKCRQLIGDCIRSFVGTAVAVYLDRTANINTYEEIFSGLTNPKHEARVKDILVSLCNNAVETYVRTSNNGGPKNGASTYSKIELENGFNGDEKLKLISTTLHARRLRERAQEGGWARKMCSAMAVPGNRKFVFDVTGLVTYEAVRSFLEFGLHRAAEGVKKGVGAVHDEVVDKGVEALRLVGGKSSSVMALCVTLCLDIVNSPWVLARH